MTEKDSSPSQTSDQNILQSFLESVLAGQVVKIQASTQAGAESIRQAAIDYILTATTEPIEAFILGREPGLEIWIRKLVGGRPKVWGCSCGAQGTEEELKTHACRLKKSGTKT